MLRRHASGATGGKHGIDDDCQFRWFAWRQPVIVGNWQRGFFVAANTEVPYFEFRNKFEERIGHAESGTKDGHKCNAGGKTVGRRRFERRFNFD